METKEEKRRIWKKERNKEEEYLEEKEKIWDKGRIREKKVEVQS